MNKLPWFRFYSGDWLKGTRGLSSRHKGIWIDLLCHMWENDPQGEIEGSWESIARRIGEPWLEVEVEIMSLKRDGIVDVVRNVSAQCPQNVRIVSRRMSAECAQRESDRRRQERRRESESFRKKEKRKKAVTDLSTKPHGQEVRSQKSEVIKDRDKDILPCDSPKDGEPTAENLLDLWNKEAHPNLPRATILTEKRKRSAAARLKEHPEHSFWEDILARVNRSSLLRGEQGNWKASFDWILNPTNLVKIAEGNYDARK